MEQHEFAKELKIEKEGFYEDNKYIIELKNSNEYSKMFTLLDESELVDVDDELTLLTDKVGELLFLGDEFDVKLAGNFISNVYRIVITKAQEEDN